MKPSKQQQAPQRQQSQAIERHEPDRSIQNAPPAYLQKPGGAPRAGFEEFEQSDVKLPRLSLCQALTPQREKTNPKYISGLEEGDFFNSIMQINYGPSLQIVPLLYFKMRLLFKSMDDGGGILCRSNDCKTGVGEPGGACIKCPNAQFGSSRNGEGKGTACLLIYNFPVLVVNEENRVTPESLAILSLKSTGIPVAQEWIVKMKFRKTDMFAGVYQLTSKFRNEGKLKWYEPVVDNAGWVSPQVLADATVAYQAMRELRAQGRLQPDLEELAAEENDENKPPF